MRPVQLEGCETKKIEEEVARVTEVLNKIGEVKRRDHYGHPNYYDQDQYVNNNDSNNNNNNNNDSNNNNNDNNNINNNNNNN